MSRALDPGSCRIRSLHRDGARLLARSERTVYSVLPDTAEHRSLLERAQLSFSTCDDGILLLGNEAYDSSRLFQAACHRLLPFGQLPDNDPLARQLLASLISGILPPADLSGEICCTTVPGGADTGSGTGRANADFLQQVIHLRGYEPKIIPAAHALIYAQLVRSSFTGIGLVFGASGCEAMLAHCGVPVCHARIDRGGHWLDVKLAGACERVVYNDLGDEVLDLDSVERRRESIRTPLTLSGQTFEQTCGRLLRQLIDALLRRFSSELNRSPRAAELPQPLPIVCSQGLSSVPGFEVLLNESLSERPLPVATELPQLVEDSDYTIARGLLIAAELEAAQENRNRAA